VHGVGSKKEAPAFTRGLYKVLNPPDANQCKEHILESALVIIFCGAIIQK
jgi:hypothetical protein